MAQSEHELKYELSEQGYHALLAGVAQEGETLHFTNAYFVVENESGRRDWVLRLRREKVGPGELTLKVGRQVSPGNFSSTEYSAQVQSDEPADWEETEPLRVFRSEISQEPIVCQGQASNERHIVRAPLGPVLYWEVDRTVLPNGKVFHELEIEYPPDLAPTSEQVTGFRAELEEWLFEQGLKATPSKKTKYRRFLDSVGFRY